MNRQQWSWQFEDDEHRVVPAPPSPVFTGRYDAEEWLGLMWRRLAERGVATARLMYDGDHVGQGVDIPPL